MPFGWKTEAFMPYPTYVAVANTGKNGTMPEQNAKQNVFDDFIAAAEYLIAQIPLFTIPSHSWWVKRRIVSRCYHDATPRTDESPFTAVGVMDMLRTTPLPQEQVGRMITERRRTAKEMFSYIKGYSPVHNVKGVQYPATMVTTGDHDDRVVPAHSLSCCCRIKTNRNQPNFNPIDINAGHGAENPWQQPFRKTSTYKPLQLYNMGLLL
jgi:prolyl oligopeptidase